MSLRLDEIRTHIGPGNIFSMRGVCYLRTFHCFLMMTKNDAAMVIQHFTKKLPDIFSHEAGLTNTIKQTFVNAAFNHPKRTADEGTHCISTSLLAQTAQSTDNAKWKYICILLSDLRWENNKQTSYDENICFPRREKQLVPLRHHLRQSVCMRRIIFVCGHKGSSMKIIKSNPKKH